MSEAGAPSATGDAEEGAGTVAVSCRCEGDGLAAAIVRQLNSFQIIACDKKGERRQSGGDEPARQDDGTCACFRRPVLASPGRPERSDSAAILEEGSRACKPCGASARATLREPQRVVCTREVKGDVSRRTVLGSHFFY